ncbi:hypothetical protein TrVFT333_003143 [Trichoderma virens FT-333]|nr:hypothetical protein TrVFT333_003143 [Trichoderma virens FT-333]
MPRMGLVAFKTRDEPVNFGSLIHNDAILYVGDGNSHVKYYIILSVVVFISILFLLLRIELQSRLNRGAPPLAIQRFLFGWVIRSHQRRAGLAPQDGQPGSYNMGDVAPGPANDSVRYAAYPDHADGGDKLHTVQEPTKRVDEESVLPVYEPPLGPPPPAVTKH